MKTSLRPRPRPRGRHAQPVQGRRVAAFVCASLALIVFVALIVFQHALRAPAAAQDAQETSSSTVAGKVDSERAGTSQEQPGDVLEAPTDADGATAATEALQAAHVSAGRLMVSQVGIDAPALPFTLTDGIADPPTWTDAYVVDGYGTPSDPTSGTSYVLVHSGYRGQALGDLLTDTEAGESHLDPGDIFYADGTAFEVVSEARYAKNDLEATDVLGVPLVPAVWEDVDGRLVLMTCLQRGQTGHALEVVVVIAQTVV